MIIRELIIVLFAVCFVFYTFILALDYSQTIPDRYPQGHDPGHGCVAIELGGFPYKLCPLNP